MKVALFILVVCLMASGSMADTTSSTASTVSTEAPSTTAIPTTTDASSTTTTVTPETTTSTSTTTTSTTTGAPTPTPTPTPTPSDKFPVYTYEQYFFPDNKTEPCFNFSFGANYDIKKQDSSLNFVMENATSYDKFECTDNMTKQELNLHFDNNTVTFTFTRNDSTEEGYLSHISVNHGGEKYDLNQRAFTTELKKNGGYLCKGEVVLGNTNDSLNFHFEHTNLLFFRKLKAEKSELTQCSADDDVNDMIPIAVGIALLVLIGIVLIAYFVGRKRSRRLSYTSV